MKTFRCTHCDQIVFFENTRCERCGSTLGFAPDEMRMRAFEVDAQGQWTARARQGARSARALPPRHPGWKPCSNYTMDALHLLPVCNWMLRADDPEHLCESCRYTAVIPPQDRPENRDYWARLEAAKRRLLYSLRELGLPVPGRAEDPEGGLSFEFLQDGVTQPKVTTGHDHGLITMNVFEADDARREAHRTAMREPYRTLLGHFRHEIGHFYWERLVATQASRLERFRAQFGDERDDYGAALQHHYEQGAPPNWWERYVSAYASCHPWEDWAETWAHYMHIADTLDTACHWRVSLGGRTGGGGTREDRAPAVLPRVQPDEEHFRAVLVEQWLPLSQFLNSMARSLGSADLYPFTLPDAVLDKLCFVHEVVRAAAPDQARREPQTAGAAA